MLKAIDLRLAANAPLLAIHGSAATGRQWDILRDQIGEARALLAMQANVVLQDFREAFAHPLPGTALRRFSDPAHIVAGGDATTHTTRMAALLAELLPNSSRSSMAGMEHMGPCTHPEAVNAAIMAWVDHAENHQPQTVPVKHSRHRCTSDLTGVTL